MEKSIDPRRDMSDAAGTASLTHLGDLKGFKVADGDPDIRGWRVKTAEGIRIGRVADLLVDSVAMKVRYMELSLDKDILDLEEHRHILVPIGSARLNDDDDVVMLNRSVGELVSMPEYRRGTITVNDERVLHDRYAHRSEQIADVRDRDRDRDRTDVRVDDRTGAAPASLYDSENFDDRRFLGKRGEGRDNPEYIVRVKEYVVNPDESVDRRNM